MRWWRSKMITFNTQTLTFLWIISSPGPCLKRRQPRSLHWRCWWEVIQICRWHPMKWDRSKTKRRWSVSWQLKTKGPGMVLTTSHIFIALPVPLAAEHIIRWCRGEVPCWWHFSFSSSSSQKIHYKIWASQICPAIIGQKRHWPALHWLWHASVVHPQTGLKLPHIAR